MCKDRSSFPMFKKLSLAVVIELGDNNTVTTTHYCFINVIQGYQVEALHTPTIPVFFLSINQLDVGGHTTTFQNGKCSITSVTGVLNRNNQYIIYRISTTASLFFFLSSSYPKTEPLLSLVQERPKLNRHKFPSPIYWKTKLPRPATTLPQTPRMVTWSYADTSTPGSRYSRVDRNEKPLSRCGLNSLLPIEKVSLQMTLQSSAERIQIVSIVDRIYVGCISKM